MPVFRTNYYRVEFVSFFAEPWNTYPHSHPLRKAFRKFASGHSITQIEFVTILGWMNEGGATVTALSEAEREANAPPIDFNTELAAMVVHLAEGGVYIV
jgi:hypothetical protein